MDSTELKGEILKAIATKDKATLKELKEQLGRDKWMAQFNGNIPLTAFLSPNPYIKFKD